MADRDHAATYRGTANRSAPGARSGTGRPGRSRATTPTSPRWRTPPTRGSTGGRAVPDPDVVPLPPTCKTMRVDAGTVTFSGTGDRQDRPGDGRGHSGDYDGPVVDQGQAVVGRHGTWQVPIGTGDLDHLYVEVDIEPTSMQHELSGGGRMRFPLEVR